MFMYTLFMNERQAECTRDRNETWSPFSYNIYNIYEVWRVASFPVWYIMVVQVLDDIKCLGLL